MSKRILSVSYDVSLLATRRMLLEQKGYKVASALGFTKAIEHCRQPHFDLFILGHSIPGDDKLSLVKTFREIVLRRSSRLSAAAKISYSVTSMLRRTIRKNLSTWWMIFWLGETCTPNSGRSK